jgi:predicted short-subunit dehydrogenase-like oxidoreductase (DUF2520 family)
MAPKPRIAIVGAGNLGSALAVSLRDAGYAIEAIVARPSPASRRKTQALAKKVGARLLSGPIANLRVDVVWFCVPDGEIQRAAQDFSRQVEWKNAAWKRTIALHSSGALPSDELSILRRRGAAVASVHPMMTFVRGSRPTLAAAPFALEGDARALRAARRIVRDLSGDAYPVRISDKPAYLAWGAFASPLLTALLVTTEQVAALAGVGPSAARRRMFPILHQTLANYATRDAAQAFSGPIIRGDIATVKRHLRVLRKVPAARDVYRALAVAALRYLPAKNKAALRETLESGRN